MSIIKIVLVSNQLDLNQNTMKKIGSALEKLNSNIHVLIIQSFDKDIINKIFEFKPVIVLTFPFDIKLMPQDFYILKYLLNFSLISLRTEGILLSHNNFNSKQMLSEQVNYGKNLVDHEFFCAANAAKLISEILLNQNKISSINRIHYMDVRSVEDYNSGKPFELIANFLLSVVNEKAQLISHDDNFLHQSILSENRGILFIETLCKKGYDLIKVQDFNLVKSENYKNALQTYFDSAHKLAKAVQFNVSHLQYFRSLCLANNNFFDIAFKTLEEEILYFPNNNDAKELYDLLLSKHKLPNKTFGKRHIYHFNVSNPNRSFEFANILLKMGDFNKYADLYEQLIVEYDESSYDLLANLYDQYEILEKQNADRYILYQSRFFNFGIKPDDKVLDIGSGNIPFHFATCLADFAIEDNEHGRAGRSFKKFQNIPAVQCDIENLPFKEKEIDFVYCSHVLEHSTNPDKACKEIMRIGKRGFIEVPSRAKDMLLSTAKASNHKWGIDLFNDTLVFMEYTDQNLEALKCNLLLNMHVHPQTVREKAFSALLYLRANIFNVMLLWEDSFDYKIFKLS